MTANSRDHVCHNRTKSIANRLLITDYHIRVIRRHARVPQHMRELIRGNTPVRDGATCDITDDPCSLRERKNLGISDIVRRVCVPLFGQRSRGYFRDIVSIHKRNGAITSRRDDTVSFKDSRKKKTLGEILSEA